MGGDSTGPSFTAYFSTLEDDPDTPTAVEVIEGTSTSKSRQFEVRTMIPYHNLACDPGGSSCGSKQLDMCVQRRPIFGARNRGRAPA